MDLNSVAHSETTDTWNIHHRTSIICMFGQSIEVPLTSTRGASEEGKNGVSLFNLMSCLQNVYTGRCTVSPPGPEGNSPTQL